MYYCIVLCIICICIYCMCVYVCSSVEERLCRTLELKITNQSIKSINVAVGATAGGNVISMALIGRCYYPRSTICFSCGGGKKRLVTLAKDTTGMLAEPIKLLGA